MSLLDDSLLSNSQVRTVGARSKMYVAKAQNLVASHTEKLVVKSDWQLQAPVPPARPLLYEHQSVSDVFKFMPELLQSDIEGMAYGVLDDVSVTHFCTAPWNDMELRAFVNKNEIEKRDRLQREEREGKPRVLVPDPRLDNPLLEKEDWDLIDTDIHESPINQRTLPSLSLFRAPIYTEAGAIAPEKRAELRLARRLTQIGAGDVEPTQEMLGTPLTQQRNSQGSFRGSTQLLRGPHDPVSKQDVNNKWKKDTVGTFRNARALDEHFVKFVNAVATKALMLKFPSFADSDDIQQSDANLQLTIDIEQSVKQFLTLINLGRNDTNSSSAPPPSSFQEQSKESKHLLPGGALGINRGGAAICNVAKLLMTYFYDDKEIVISEAVASLVEETFSVNVQPTVFAWLEDYCSLLQRCGHKMYPPPEDVLDVVSGCHTKESLGGSKVVLRNGSAPGAFPTSVRPLVPSSDEPDYPDQERSPMDGSLSVLLFRGARPRVFRHGETHILLDNSQLFYPTFRDDEAEAIATRYEGELSGFEPYLEDRKAKNRLLLTFGKHEVGFQRIPRTVEYVRKTGTLVSRPPQYLVVWNGGEEKEDDDPTAAAATVVGDEDTAAATA